MYSTYSKIVKPKTIEFTNVSEDGSFGRFNVGPLPAGCGITVANSMRRILLSSLKGSKVASIKIDGVLHEFSTLPGVCQDMLTVEHNLQGVVFKTNLDEASASLEVKGSAVVTAGMIKLPAGVEVVNKDHFLFELQSDASVSMKIAILSGIGHVFQELETKKQSQGTIYPDIYFSPIKRVNHNVEQTRVEKDICTEKLTMEVETDGSISAKDAVAVAAGILRDLFECFMYVGTISVLGDGKVEEKSSTALAYNYNLLKRIDDLDLSVRSANCFSAVGYKYVGDIACKTEQDLLQLANFGRKSLDEVRACLTALGLSFGSIEKIEWPPKDMQVLLDAAKKHFGDN